MARGRVKNIPPLSNDSHPKSGSIGTIWSLTNGMIAFVPDDVDDFPPDCSVDEFGFYTLEPFEVEILEG